MFKRQAVNKLPTLNQYLKENHLKDETVERYIEKIFWSDDWNTITFQTDCFRYSIKFSSDDEYSDAIDDVRGVYKPNNPMLALVTYSGETGEVDVTWEPLTKSEVNQDMYQFKEWDWGLTAEPYKHKKSPASKKKPPSKMVDPDTPPAQLDPTL